jgi:hypothetical protein
MMEDKDRFRRDTDDEYKKYRSDVDIERIRDMEREKDIQQERDDRIRQDQERPNRE